MKPYGSIMVGSIYFHFLTFFFILHLFIFYVFSFFIFLNPEKYCFSLIYSKIRKSPIFVTKTLRTILYYCMFSHAN